MTDVAPPIPDLLSASARVRVDVAAIRQALVFAFASGVPQDTFDDIVARAALPSTSWDPTAFARDVYLDELVTSAFAVHVLGRPYRTCSRYLASVLGQPPTSNADVDARRSVIEELIRSASARADLERVYVDVARLRALLCSPRTPSARGRRVEVLRAVRETIDHLAASFEGAQSPLSRLREFGRAVVSTEPFLRLSALLDHEEHRASLDLRVRVGADGEVRALEVVRVHEESANPFYVSVFRRFIARLVLFLRGYRVTSGEIAERLLSEVFSGLEEPIACLFQIAADSEVYLGCLCFRDRARELGLDMVLPERVGSEEALFIEGLYNPHLIASGIVPIPCDLRAGPRAVALVTGPNSGGKTRLLQAISIAQLLADSGLLVPARIARIPAATGLFASLFEEADASQPEGHLGMELLRIRRLFEQMDAGGLVVLDELCSGTNPAEGEEIARLVLSLLPELGTRAFVTTHLLRFAEALSEDVTVPSGEFLQAEVDAEDRPTYRFVPGVARTSLAHKTAARLGVTREEILDRIATKRLRRQKATK